MLSLQFGPAGRARALSGTPWKRDRSERVERNAICSLDGAAADPELRSNFVKRFLRNASHDEHEPAKYIQPGMNIFGILDQQSKVLSQKRGALYVGWFAVLILASKLRDRRVLPEESTSKGSQGSPLDEPFVKDRRLSLGNGAGIDCTLVCELLVSDQEDGQPVQPVVIIPENVANVFCCGIATLSADFLKYHRKFCHFFSPGPDRGRCNASAKHPLVA